MSALPRLVFMGTADLAATVLRRLSADPRWQVILAVSQPDRPKGRDLALQPTPVKQAALEVGIPVDQPAKARDPVFIERLRSLAPDLMVVAAYGLILPPEVLSLPRLGCLNIHASLLPRWRGAAPIQRAVLAGDTESGVTIMQMDEGLDTGAMLLRRALPITPQMVAGELHDALAPLGADLLLEALEGLQAGTLQATPQPAEGVTWADKLTREEARLDWQQPAQRLDRQIRAFNPWPAAHALYAGEPVKLLRSRLLPGEVPPGVAPGTVLGLLDGSLAVASGQGLLGIDELQRAGRRAVAARDFANAEGATAGAGRCFS